SYAVPWKLFVPDFVTTLTIPPALRPYSALYVLVNIRNSSIMSGFGLSTTPLFRRLLLTPPSRRYVTESWRPPATLKQVEVPPHTLRFPPAIDVMTPGCNSARSSVLRLFRGIL